MTWDWLSIGKRREIKFSWTWRFSGPDAGKDKCLKCAVERRYHNRDHPFEEKTK